MFYVTILMTNPHCRINTSLQSSPLEDLKIYFDQIIFPKRLLKRSRFDPRHHKKGNQNVTFTESGKVYERFRICTVSWEVKSSARTQYAFFQPSFLKLFDFQKDTGHFKCTPSKVYELAYLFLRGK